MIVFSHCIIKMIHYVYCFLFFGQKYWAFKKSFFALHTYWSFIEKTSVKQSMKHKVCSNLADQVADQLADLPPWYAKHHGKKFFFLADLPPIKCQMAISDRFLL